MVTIAHDIVCDWTVTESTTYRFKLSDLVVRFSHEYAEAKANGLSDREFVEESIDMGGANAGCEIVGLEHDTECNWKTP